MKQTETKKTQKSATRVLWYGGIAAGLVLVLTGGLLGSRLERFHPGDAFVVSAASYPQMAAYPDESQYTTASGDIKDSYYDAYDAWWEEQRARMELPDGISPVSLDFYGATMAKLLKGAPGENQVYSPLNLYFALSMLAEITDGNSRSQILDLLGVTRVEDLREQNQALWKISYCDDGASTCILSNSLWMNQSVNFRKSTLDSLARSYYASSFKGEMGSEDLNLAFQNWLNQQTGGLLKEQVARLTLEPETVLALASTMYFRSKWTQEFSKGQTIEGTFHTDQGDITCPFMRQSENRNYYWGEQFSAVGCSLESGGDMWFLLPDEGVSLDKLLEDGQAVDFLLSKGQWDNSKSLMIHLSVPKFDVSSDLNLQTTLSSLGISDVFDPALADFSPLCQPSDNLFLSQAKHAARVSIDEEGCLAAAYTVMTVCGAGAPPDEIEEIDFVLDRPFLFGITGTTGELLFAGAVHHPGSSD